MCIRDSSHRLRHGGAPYPETLRPAALDEADFVSGFTREGFIDAVQKAQDYIRAGDAFQAVSYTHLDVYKRQVMDNMTLDK